MSKKKPNDPALRGLIPTGPKQIQKKFHGKRDENGLKPSTSRALILRNGKYGAQGTGEITLAGRISGREKLDLLAEDLVAQRSRTALMAPFKLDKCIKIADSQYNAYLDDIVDLKDPVLFYDRIMAELAARSPPVAQGSKKPALNPSQVASVVSTRIHNAYLVSSGWKLVVEILGDLRNSGLNDAIVRAQLQSDDKLRSRYLVLCDVVGVLVELGQAHFSLLATTTPHYSRYFKEIENAQPRGPSIAFDWAGLKDACKSFLDSIIIELCFPRSPYPKRVLYHILHDSVDESPREAKRFPQAMWDAVGDLSVSLELQELLESSLSGPQGQKLRTLPRQMPRQYDKWLDAQIYSNQASELYANFNDLINPLEKTKDPSVLDDMWELINHNYKTASGLSIDSLWQLDEAFRRTPQWSSFYMPSLRNYDSDSDDENPSIPRLRATGTRRSNGKKPKKLLAITDGHVDDADSNGSMPELQSVSDSSGEDDEDIFVSEDEEESDDDETDYDSEDDEHYRTMLREAMDTVMAIPEFFDPKTAVPEFDALAEERKENPFLKLLGSLRGRMFSSNPKLSSATRTEPRRGLFGQKSQATKAPAKQTATPAPGSKTPEPSGGGEAPPTHPAPSEERQPASTSEEPKGYLATVEDAEDEEDTVPTPGRKKKKKPKKKKKKKPTNELPTVHEDSAPAISTPPKNSHSSTLAETPIRAPSNTHPPSNASVNTLGHMSTSSLPIEPAVAQSAHSYLQELGSLKEKVKSRPNHASLFSDKRGFFSKLGSKDKTKKEDENNPTTNKKSTWFNKLGKKTSEYMHQLLRTNADEKVGSLKWDNFLKVMRDMGFKYDPSTAGSSVRFDPPDPRDKSITFHKPHPDTTLHASDLWKIRKRLRNYYGWSEEDFLRRTSTA